MKALIPLLIVSTSALAVTTVQYAQRAGTERKRADEAHVIAKKQEVQIHELQQVQGTLQQALQTAQRPAEPAAETRATLTRAPAPPMKSLALRAAPAPAGAMGYAARIDAANGGAVSMSSARPLPYAPLQQQLSPAAQRYMRTQMKTGMRRQYEDLGPAMGLPQERADKFVDLLLEQQTRGFGDVRKLNVDMKDAMQAAQEMKKRNDAEIAALIGPDKLPAWEEYQKSMPDRAQVNMVREQMQSVGMPLTEDQRARLLDVVTAHRQSNPRPLPVENTPPEEMFAQSMKWQEESDRALLESAKSVLTPAQYQHYRDYQEWQSEMRNNSMRSFRMIPGPGGAAVSATSSFIAADPPPAAK